MLRLVERTLLRLGGCISCAVPKKARLKGRGRDGQIEKANGCICLRRRRRSNKEEVEGGKGMTVAGMRGVVGCSRVL